MWVWGPTGPPTRTTWGRPESQTPNGPPNPRRAPAVKMHKTQRAAATRPQATPVTRYTSSRPVQGYRNPDPRSHHPPSRDLVGPLKQLLGKAAHDQAPDTTTLSHIDIHTHSPKVRSRHTHALLPGPNNVTTKGQFISGPRRWFPSFLGGDEQTVRTSVASEQPLSPCKGREPPERPGPGRTLSESIRRRGRKSPCSLNEPVNQSRPRLKQSQSPSEL